MTTTTDATPDTVPGEVITTTTEPAPLPFKEVLARYAAIQAVVKSMNDYAAVAKAEVFRQMLAKRDEDGTKSFNVMVDGEKIAGATISEPKGKPDVKDEDTLVAWVEENYPSEVDTVTIIQPKFREKLLKRLKAEDEGMIDPDTGCIVPGVEWKPAGEAKTFSINGWDEAAKEALIARLFAQMPEQLSIEGGEGK